jgi:CzcA family heavy metal efflux pump
MILSDAAIRHRTTVFVLLVIIVFMGLSAYGSLPRESAPDIKIPFMNIVTVYPGVAPGDVETLLTIPIENELKNLRDVEEINSVSAEGASIITVEFEPSVDLDFALQKVKEKVDSAEPDLPEDAEEPMVQEITTSEFPIMQINISGGVDLVRLKEIGEDLQDLMEGIQGVLRVELVGGVEREIRVEYDPRRLAGYGLSPNDIVRAVQAANVNIPGGSLELGEAEYLLRVPGEFEDPAEINDLVLRHDGERPVYVRDVATVVDGYKEVETMARHNGRPSVTLSVRKRAGENIVVICDEVRALLERVKPDMPAGLEMTVVFDESKDIRNMVADLENNILNALVLVMGVIFFFMGLVNSIFVALAIPFTMLISFAVLSALGYTLNIVVLFSLILALGMLVDNAIVIVENIYRHMHEGRSRVDAAITGTAEVAWPVITSTATTLCAFFPMIFWPGIMGEFMSYLPRTLIITLTASLFVALVINPTLCSVFMKVTHDPAKDEKRGGMERLSALYERFLGFALDHYISSLVLSGAFLVGIIFLYGIFGKGVLFFPAIEPNRAIVNIEAPKGTSLLTTDGYVREAEDAARCCGEVDHVIADVGSGGGEGMFGGAGSSQANAARVSVVFPAWSERQEKASGTLAKIRESLEGTIVGAEVNVTEEEQGPPTGAPVNIEVSGEDFTALARSAARIVAAVKEIEGVVDLKDDYDPGQPEIRVEVDKERASLLGVSTADVATTVRAAVNGVEAGVFREADEEYDIIVRLPKGKRDSLSALRHLTVSDIKGNQVPLTTMTRLEMASGLGSIRRLDQKRVVTVTANVRDRLAEDVRREVEEAVGALELPAGVQVSYTGENVEQEESEAFMMRAFVIAVLLIFLVLVTQFNSVGIPFIIIFAILLSLVGVYVGLLVTATPFGVIMTGIGVISLAGVVVNNSIVLLDYIEKSRARGLALREALILSGKVRLRPVLLTAITTICGLIPMATGVNIDFRNMAVEFGSETSQWWNSLAVAVIFGLAFATILTLVVVPTFYRAFYGRAEARRVAALAGGTANEV